MNDPCQRFESELSAYFDGELSVEEHARVARHLESCRRCAGEARRLSAVSGVLRRWDAQETRYAQSHAFRSRVLRRVGGEEATQVVPSPSPSWGRLAAAAAVVAAAALGASRLVGTAGPDRDERLDRLEQEFAALQRPVEPTNDRAGLDLPAVGSPAWDQVIRNRGATVIPEAPSENFPSVAWENRGEHMIARPAAVDYERFEAERRDLRLYEKVRGSGASGTRAGTTAGAPQVSPVASFLASTRLAADNFPAFKRVQVWPIVTDGAGRRGLDGSGVVPLSTQEALRGRLLFAHDGESPGTVELRTADLPRPILILVGDVLAGGRQDRVAGEDVLLGPDTTLTISLAASGRARKRSSYTRHTASAGLAPAGARAQLAAHVPQSGFDEVVAHTVAVLGSPGGQGSLHNLFGNTELLKEADSYARMFDQRLARPDVVGFAVAAGSQLLGVEVFGDSETFQAMRPRVIRSYLFEALSLSTEAIMGSPPPREQVEAALAAAGRGVIAGSRSAGEGTVRDIADAETDIIGFGLSRNGEVVHAVVFPGSVAGTLRAAARRRRSASRDGPDTGPDLDSGKPEGPGRGAVDEGGGLKPDGR